MNLASVLWTFQLLWTIPTIFSLSAPSVSQFQVRSLPGSPALPTSWAGRLPVPGREGNEIFFWLFDTENPTYDDNLIIWLNGGPGCSSLIGLTTGNGPIAFAGNSTRLIENHYSWTKLGHVLYLDQPVGTGFSIASDLVNSNEQVTANFALWLQGFFTRFPHLQNKKLHLIGESYAGIFIPYFADALLEGNYSLPVDLRSMSLGDGSWGNAAAMSSVAMGKYMETHKQRLNVPADILSEFSAADKICGFDTVLNEANVYPPQGKIHIPGNPEYVNYRRSLNQDQDLARRDLSGLGIVNGSCDSNPSTPAEVRSSILNSSCYGPCATFSTAENYMYASSACFSIYDLTHDCSTVDPLPLLQEYFSRDDVQSALHIGGSGAYAACNDTIMTVLESGAFVQPPEYEILPSLVTNHNVSLHFYNGEMDMLINHIGTELSIQNMTWRGAQGFQKKPSSVFYANNAVPSGKAKTSTTAGTAAGIWAAERGVSYHRFSGAGHSVFATKQRAMFAFVRDVVVGEKAG